MPMRRRHLLQLPALALPVALAGCGFALRRPAVLQLSTVSLKGFASRSSMADDLRYAIERRGSTQVVEAQAQAVLEQLASSRDRVMAAQTTAGQVRELTLRLHFKFQVLHASGKVAIAPSELVLSRDLSYNESVALAKEQEEELLYRAMQADIVAQVLRRLATVVPERAA